MSRRGMIPVAALLLAALASCVTSRPAFMEAPRPPSTARLRVFVQPLEVGERWRTPYSEFAASTFEKVRKVWYDTGVYETVSLETAGEYLGRSRKNLRWKADGYALAIEAARALWADYAMLVERVDVSGSFAWRTTLINARTGAAFKVSMNVPGGSREDYQPIIRASYKQLFQDARSDMMATAAYRRSGGELPRGPFVQQAASPAVSRDLVFREAAAAPQTAPVVAVYDIEAPESDRLVASILSEALRAELLNLGKFRLVDRANMEDVLAEMELQLSGVVDEKLAVKAGAGLAAQQIVVGQFGAVGKNSVLQAKRIDISTQRTLGVQSLRCETGSEEKLLDAMAALAAQLAKDS